MPPSRRPTDICTAECACHLCWQSGTPQSLGRCPKHQWRIRRPHFPVFSLLCAGQAHVTQLLPAVVRPTSFICRRCRANPVLQFAGATSKDWWLQNNWKRKYYVSTGRCKEFVSRRAVELGPFCHPLCSLPTREFSAQSPFKLRNTLPDTPASSMPTTFYNLHKPLATLLHSQDKWNSRNVSLIVAATSPPHTRGKEVAEVGGGCWGPNTLAHRCRTTEQQVHFVVPS